MGRSMTDRARRRAWIRRLLREREREGLTIAELSRRSGEPVGTLASWMARLRREAQAGPLGAYPGVSFIAKRGPLRLDHGEPALCAG